MGSTQTHGRTLRPSMNWPAAVTAMQLGAQVVRVSQAIRKVCDDGMIEAGHSPIELCDAISPLGGVKVFRERDSREMVWPTVEMISADDWIVVP